MGKKFSHTYKKKKWLKGSCWSKCEYTIHNQIIHLQIVYWLTSVVVGVDRDRCSNCRVCYCKTERIKLQFGFWILWANWNVSFALEGCDCSNCWVYYCNLQNKTNQTAFWMLWANWIVSFVVGGCDWSLYCQIRSWRQIYLAAKYSIF